MPYKFPINYILSSGLGNGSDWRDSFKNSPRRGSYNGDWDYNWARRSTDMVNDYNPPRFKDSLLADIIEPAGVDGLKERVLDDAFDTHIERKNQIIQETIDDTERLTGKKPSREEIKELRELFSPDAYGNIRGTPIGQKLIKSGLLDL